MPTINDRIGSQNVIRVLSNASAPPTRITNLTDVDSTRSTLDGQLLVWNLSDEKFYMTDTIDTDGLIFTAGGSATGITTFSGTVDSTSSTNGAIIVSGGVGVAKNLNVGQDFKVVGLATFSNELDINAAVDILRGLNVSGITSVQSLSIGSTQVISSARELQNITSLDATTTATIEAAIEVAPNRFTDLKITGVSTFIGIATFGGGIAVQAGVSTFDVAVDINAGLDVDGQADLDEVVIAGVTTFNNADVVFQGASGSQNMTWDASANDLKFTDTARLQLGNSQDLEFWHGTNSHIKNSTNDLRIRSDSILLKRADDSEKYLEATVNADVKLFYNGNEKVATTAEGIDVTGRTETDLLNVTGIATFGAVDINGIIDIDGQLDVDELVVAGVSTFNGNVDINNNLDVVGGLTADSLTISGVTTGINAAGISSFVQLDVSTGGLDVDGQADLDEVVVAGVTTHQQDVYFPGAAYNIQWDQATSKFKFDDSAQAVWGSASGGDLRIWHASDVSNIKNDTGQLRIAGNDIRLQTQNNSADYLLAVDGGSVSIFYDDEKRFETSGIGATVSGQLDVTNVSASGVVTATSFTGNITGNVVGNVTGDLTGDVTAVDLTAHGIGVTSLNVAGVSTLTGNVTVGGSLDVDGLADLDDVNVAGASTIAGAFKVGGNIQGDAKLGIGTAGTAPEADIQIYNATESTIAIGRSQSITGTNASIRFGTSNGSFPYSSKTPESLDIINYGKGNVNFHLEAGTVGLGTGSYYWHRRSSFDQLMVLTYGGRLGLGVTLPDNTLHVVGTSTVTQNAWFGLNVNVANNITVAGVGSFGSLVVPSVSTLLLGNVNTTSGVSTFNELKATGFVQFDDANGVGIGTTANGNALTIGNHGKAFFSNGGRLFLTNDDGTALNASTTRATFKGIGVGTDNPDAGADFGNCGYTTSRHMILPKVTTTQRGNLNNITNGSIIYNTSTNKFQGRANGAWVDLH